MDIGFVKPSAIFPLVSIYFRPTVPSLNFSDAVVLDIDVIRMAVELRSLSKSYGALIIAANDSRCYLALVRAGELCKEL